MPVMTKAETSQMLADYRQRIAGILLSAWSDWSSTSYSGTWRCRRSRANFVWEQIIARAHSEFLGEHRIEILRKNESYVFLLDNTLAFRFKKSDEAGITANVPTQAALEFHDPQCDLPGLPEISRIDISYVVNKLETAIADILVVGRDKNKEVWTFSLLDDADVVPFPMPIAPAPLDGSGKARPHLRLVRISNQDPGDRKEDIDGQP